MARSPYHAQPDRAYWKKAVADIHYLDTNDLWTPLPLTRRDRVATAGSCFAQHIGNNLALRGANFIDMEPAPPLFSSPEEARQFGFGVYSCRYGNIYTSRQLVQLFDEAHGRRIPVDRIWRKGDRYYDAMRPGVDPVGQDSPESVLALRNLHLARVREMFATVDVFIFTMGLTEGWEAISDGTIYPTAPGTIAGDYDSKVYRFLNLRHGEILQDMQRFRSRLLAVNPKARILLTVSPVPLTATATDQHVLVATTYSKSVLRSVAGEMANDYPDVYYFPSYEIISSHPGQGRFFNRDQRTVNPAGVEFVMRHFFSGALAREFGDCTSGVDNDLEVMCDEEALARE